MNRKREGLMVVDMQEGFLNRGFNSRNNISRLIDNVCIGVIDAIKKGKKIFIVEFDGYGELNPDLKRVLNGDAVSILKERDYFSILEKKGYKYGLYYGELDNIESMELAGVHTNFCVREAYRTIHEQGIDCGLKLGATLNLSNAGTSLEYVTRHYREKNRITPTFIGKKEGNSLLESYL